MKGRTLKRVTILHCHCRSNRVTSYVGLRYRTAIVTSTEPRATLGYDMNKMPLLHQQSHELCWVTISHCHCHILEFLFACNWLRSEVAGAEPMRAQRPCALLYGAVWALVDPSDDCLRLRSRPPIQACALALYCMSFSDLATPCVVWSDLTTQRV